MDILYISSLSSEDKIKSFHKRNGDNPGFAVQKFNRLLVKGFILNDINIKTFSNPPITAYNWKEKVVNFKDEKENDILYKYVPFINIPLIKHICIFIYSFFYVFFWGQNGSKKKVIICDILSISMCMGAMLASKLKRIRSVGILTDMPGYMMSSEKSFFSKLATIINMSYINSFSYYIFLTEEMNFKVNKNKRPYLVMEAICDSTINVNQSNTEKSNPRTILYAGGLYEKYGLKMLVDAFLQSKVDARLVIYGSGPYEKELLKICSLHPNVEYRGVALNATILEEESKSYILVNPRFTTEEFTKYSFPSKNIEYMASGTPLLTTKLPGMPKDYYPYVFFFSEETVDGYAKSISDLFDLSEDLLLQKGLAAKNYVLEYKNNKKQVRRIIDMIS